MATIHPLLGRLVAISVVLTLATAAIIAAETATGSPAVAAVPASGSSPPSAASEPVTLSESEPVCGNGVVESGEPCDVGDDVPGDCCSASCRFEPFGTLCRPSVGVCDLPEICSGLGPTCAQDRKSTALCRLPVGACDVGESCDGSSDTCPADQFLPATEVCRPAAGACDVEETCSGTSRFCPLDRFVAAGTPCNDGNACTPTDVCAAGVCGGAIDPTCGAARCQRALTGASSKFVKARADATRKCLEERSEGAHGDPCPDPSAPPGTPARAAAEAIARAAARLAARVDAYCGGDDRVCGGDLTNEAGGQSALGWPAVCPDLQGAACAGPIGDGDCTGVAACLRCLGDAAVEQATALYWPDAPATDPPPERDLERCRIAIGRETTKLLLAKEKALRACWDGRLAGRHGERCPDAYARAGSPARTAAEKIARAESKKVARICKACGGASKTCDVDVDTRLVVAGGAIVAGDPRALDDLQPAAIGLGSTCPALTLPSAPGTACALVNALDGNPFGIDSLRELILCLDCVTAFKVDCAVAARVPQLVPYPAACEAIPPDCWGGCGITPPPFHPELYDVLAYADPVAGRTFVRSYMVHVPPSYEPGTPMPLVVNFHGALGTGEAAEIGVGGMNAKADASGFIAAYPNGLSRIGWPGRQQYWYAGTEVDLSLEPVDDVGFVAAMLDDLQARYTVDPGRIYATGISNGAWMSYAVACELSDRFAAIAPAAGGLVWEPCVPAHPISIIHFHGTGDPGWPYDGGGSCWTDTIRRPIQETRARWIELDDCTDVPEITYQNGAATCVTHQACRDGAALSFCTIAGGGHTYPGGAVSPGERLVPWDADCALGNGSGVGAVTQDLSALDAMWTFFQAHPKP